MAKARYLLAAEADKIQDLLFWASILRGREIATKPTMAAAVVICKSKYPFYLGPVNTNYDRLRV